MRGRIILLKDFRAKTTRELSFLFREAFGVRTSPRVAFLVAATGLTAEVELLSWRDPH